jgi:hypothetical protein
MLPALCKAAPPSHNQLVLLLLWVILLHNPNNPNMMGIIIHGHLHITFYTLIYFVIVILVYDLSIRLRNLRVSGPHVRDK